MLKFKQFISEEKKGGLHIFDIDDTLFHTTAKVGVKSASGQTRTLSNADYNTDTRKPGEQYDYSEFRSADKFSKESKPISKMLGKLNSIHANVKKSPGSKVIINTARSDFDDKDKFLNTFKKHGVDIDDIHVHRAGNIESDEPVAAKKSMAIKHHLDSNKYRHATLYDDSKPNLDHFLSLKAEYPHMKFNAYHVQPNGSVKRHK